MNFILVFTSCFYFSFFLFMDNNMAIALAFALGAIGPAIGIGLIGMAALNSIGRNPSAVKDIRGTMILAIAFAEALGIFGFVVAMILKFV
jgi:F-type H+-transporting ATPase subunit c